ncbi:MAG: TatD family hydrolase [Candidatus Limivicinus sp.]|jgi:TatD DNase family protein
MYFDTHAHYDDEAFDSDRDELLPALREAGVRLIVDPGCSMASSRKALELAEKYSFIYAAAGLHPEDIDSAGPGYLSELRELASRPKCVAIGEIGLDYYWDDTRKEEQKQIFREQIELALELDMPIIVHDREAHGDSFEIVSCYPGLRGVFHCYSGSAEMAKELLKRGWYLGFDGPVTYKNARKAAEVLELCPLDRILLETDSPYLSPVPLRGSRNNSANLKYVAEKIGALKGLTPQEVCNAAFENGKRLFNIK